MATPKLDPSKFRKVATTPEGPAYIWYTDVQLVQGKDVPTPYYAVKDQTSELSCLIGMLTRHGFIFTPAHELRRIYGRRYQEELEREGSDALGRICPLGYTPHIGEFGYGLYPASIATFNYYH